MKSELNSLTDHGAQGIGHHMLLLQRFSTCCAINYSCLTMRVLHNDRHLDCTIVILLIMDYKIHICNSNKQ